MHHTEGTGGIRTYTEKTAFLPVRVPGKSIRRQAGMNARAWMIRACIGQPIARLD
ncbi:hypothetical protein DPMN_132154 [Dreissena polymorpha]|uniref:Uncharacterized protein n=1 Tax=Dreissena polymorpha TaxID=45954 RepID=A0A9D4JCI4_DREPO|nr:hypothetical protein DPMN_131754 [Dreissena polymorpha]KAH3803884.1 hypothetical protein DPMN_132154 [Dreissena polymorpha]